MIENLKNIINIITYKTYRDMRDEWNTQNREIDLLRTEVSKIKKEKDELEDTYKSALDNAYKKHERELKKLQKDGETLAERGNELQKELDSINMTYILKYEELEKRLNEKETQRKSAVGKLTAANKKIKKLEEELENCKTPVRSESVK